MRTSKRKEICGMYDVDVRFLSVCLFICMFSVYAADQASCAYTAEGKVAKIEACLSLWQPDYVRAKRILYSPVNLGYNIVSSGPEYFWENYWVVRMLARSGVIVPRTSFKHMSGRHDREGVNMWRYAVALGAVEGGHIALVAHRPTLGDLPWRDQFAIIEAAIHRSENSWQAALQLPAFNACNVGCLPRDRVNKLVKKFSRHDAVPIHRNRAAYILLQLVRHAQCYPYRAMRAISPTLIAFRGHTPQDSIEREWHDIRHQQTYNTRYHSLSRAQRSALHVLHEYLWGMLHDDFPSHVNEIASDCGRPYPVCASKDAYVRWPIVFLAESQQGRDVLRDLLFNACDASRWPSCMHITADVVPQAPVTRLFRNVTLLHYAAVRSDNYGLPAQLYIRLRHQATCPPLYVATDPVSSHRNNPYSLYQAAGEVKNEVVRETVRELHGLETAGMFRRVSHEILSHILAFRS